MANLCAKCASHLEPQWKFCPSCGVERTPEIHEAVHAHPAREKAPIKGAFTGLFFGLIAAPVLIIAGGMICLTGLGIVLGIPLIVAGVLAPLIGPTMGINSLKAACPWCGAEVSGVSIFDKFSCPTCGEHIVMKKHELLKADS